MQYWLCKAVESPKFWIKNKHSLDKNLLKILFCHLSDYYHPVLVETKNTWHRKLSKFEIRIRPRLTLVQIPNLPLVSCMDFTHRALLSSSVSAEKIVLTYRFVLRKDATWKCSVQKGLKHSRCWADAGFLLFRQNRAGVYPKTMEFWVSTELFKILFLNFD